MSEETSKESTLGALPDDAVRVRRCLDELGWTQTKLAQEAGLSLAMINVFLRGKKKLSPAASDRVMDAVKRGIDQQNAVSQPRLTPEAAARIRQRANELSDKPLSPEEIESIIKEFGPGDDEHFFDATNEGNPFSFLTTKEALAALSGPPRDRVAYEAWKAKQIELHAAAKELPIAKSWIKHQDKRAAELTKQVSLLEQIKSSHEEVISLYQGLVSRLKQQLIAAGLTPIE